MQSYESQKPINYLLLFIKHAFLILIVASIVTAISIGLNRHKEPAFTATATLIVDFQDPVNTSNVRSVLPAMLQEDYMATQLGIINSKFMAEKVLAHLDFREDPMLAPIYRRFAEYTPVDSAIHTAISNWLLKRLRVYVHNKTTRLIKISFQYEQRDVAIRIANVFAQKYIETSLDLNVAPIRSSAEWIEEHTKPIKASLAQAETTLASGTGIDKINSLLDSASSGLGNLTLMLNPRNSSQSSGRENAYLLKIRSDILKAEQLLTERSRSYGRSHPEYINVVSEVRLLKKEFLTEVKKEIDSMKITMDSLRQSLALKSSVNHTNVTLLNLADVDVESDEVSNKKAGIYGAVLGVFIGIILSFFLMFFRNRQF